MTKLTFSEIDDRDDDSLMGIAAVRKDLGNVSDMFVARRLADDPDFPRPLYVSNRRYWRRGEIQKWKRLKAATGKAQPRGCAARAVNAKVAAVPA